MESDLGVVAGSRPGASATSVSLVSRRTSREGGRVAVRVTFHAGYGGSRVTDTTVYQNFFSRLSKAVALEAGQL